MGTLTWSLSNPGSENLHGYDGARLVAWVTRYSDGWGVSVLLEPLDGRWATRGEACTAAEAACVDLPPIPKRWRPVDNLPD